jgi:Tfp pilus assembly protein PilO
MVLKSREKILIILAVIAIAIWAFDHFYYTPQNRKIKALKEELKAADLKLDESLLMTKAAETLEAEVLRQEEVLRRLSERTLRGQEFRTFLRHLARESDSPQMKVVSLTPQEENLPSPEGKEGGSTPQYRRVVVQVVLHSTYAKLRTYLKEIEELLFLINVDNIQIEKNEEAQPLLKVSMGLSMYITGESERVQGSRGPGVL